MANTQGPKTALDIMARMQAGNAGPHGDEIWERLQDTVATDTFGDEIHELFSRQMTFLNQLDSPNQNFKARYWEPNGDVSELAKSVDGQCHDTPKSPESNALMATALLLMANQPSPLGQATKKDMNAAAPGLSVESVMEGPALNM